MGKLFVAAPIIIAVAIALIAGTITFVRIQSPEPQVIQQITIDTKPADQATTTNVTLPMLVSQHNSASSCWLLINGKAYDVTNFLSLHPGGRGTILSSCGTDATSVFTTKGGNGRHSSYAWQLLEQYAVSVPTASQNTTVTQPSQNTTPVMNITTTKPTPTPAQITPALTTAELAKHNTATSCWLLINGNVYDVTNFLSLHPGGRRTILNSCGTDATRAFQTRGGGGVHSSYAWNLLDSYAIGTLGGSTTLAAAPVNPLNMPTGEYEDD